MEWDQIANIRGPKGDIGLTGPQGEAGQAGQAGPQGIRGASWFRGTVPPEESAQTVNSIDGDWYINTATWDTYQKAGGAWVNRGVIKGETGETGDRGPQGIQGIDGEQGIEGPRGAVGNPATTITTITPFTVPAIGQTVDVEVENAEWIIPGQTVWIANAAGLGKAKDFEVEEVDGNQLTLLNPYPPGELGDLVSLRNTVEELTQRIDTLVPQLSNVILTGMIIPYGGEEAPEGYLICDGESYPRILYPKLSAVLGTTFGGDEENFNVPDCRNHVLAGVGNKWMLGELRGEFEHTLSVAELASHQHPIDFSQINHAHSYSTIYGAGTIFSGYQAQYAGATLNTSTATFGVGASQNTGSGTAHNNVQPSLGINYVIRT